MKKSLHTLLLVLFVISLGALSCSDDIQPEIPEMELEAPESIKDLLSESGEEDDSTVWN